MMRVELTYFKPESGKYYSSADYDSTLGKPWEIFDEVKTMRKEGKLPGLVEGASDFDVLVNIPDLYPALLKTISGDTKAALATAFEKTEEMQQWRSAATEFAVDAGRLRMAAQSALGFMEGIVHEDLCSKKFVKDSALQQIEQLRSVLNGVQRCGYCNKRIVRAVCGSGFIHLESGLRTCVANPHPNDPLPSNATPER